jgi:hypothetical protein
MLTLEQSEYCLQTFCSPCISLFQVLPRALGPLYGGEAPRRRFPYRDSIRREVLRKDPSEDEDIALQITLVRLPLGQGQRHRVEVLGHV